MKQSYLVAELFPGSDAVRGYTFKTTQGWDTAALLAKENNRLAAFFAASWARSAHFRKKDCFECLSPHKKAA